MQDTPTSFWRRVWRSWYDWDRRDQEPAWMPWLGTLAFSAGIALVFFLVTLTMQAPAQTTALSGAQWLALYGRFLVISGAIGGLTHVIFELCRRTWAPMRRVKTWPMWRRSVFFSVVPFAGVLLGWPLGAWLAGLDEHRAWWWSGRHPIASLGASLALAAAISFVLHHWFSAKAREADALRRAAEARLRLLQGQIEPHFLFNTLANVQSLIEIEPQRARQMLEAFTDYLRSSFGGLRAERHTVGQELSLVRAYLAVLALRMEDRLKIDVVVPAELLTRSLPPLVLQPLVENAITHGLEPQVDGGTVSIRAGLDADRLWLSVCDDGLGLQGAPAATGQRSAVANIRERLLHHFGNDAQLTLEPVQPHGTCARLTLPLTA